MLLAAATPSYTNFVSYQNGISTILSNASITPIGTAVKGVAISLVAVTALIGVYEAFIDGGNIRALCLTFFKYILAAFIINNWTQLFSTMVTDVATVTSTLTGNANVNSDVFDAFQQSLQTYYATTGDGIIQQLWNAATGNVLMAILTAICSFIESVAYTFFCLLYTFWGAILWGIGPIIVALLPSSGLGKYATAYLSKVGEWLMWPILYAILGAIMVALQMNTATAITNTTASQSAQVTQVYIVVASIALCVCLVTIPFTAHALITGQFTLVGGAVMAVAAKAGKIMTGTVGTIKAGMDRSTAAGRAERGEARAERMEAMAMARSGDGGGISGSGGGRMPPPPTPDPISG
jgi:hypothetical protein